MISRMPDALREPTLFAITDALHPIYAVAAVMAVIAFIGSFFVEELPLADKLENRED